MDFRDILEKASAAFAGVKLGGKKGDPKLAALDRGVLMVGLLVAALDGSILPEEYAAFQTLAKKCRGASAANLRRLLDAVLPEAGRLMAMAQVGAYSEKDRLAAFLAAATKALPRGFADGTLADLRRAFAWWIALGLSDGGFSAFERKAVGALWTHFAEICLFRKRKIFCLERDFVERTETVLSDFAVPARRAKAEVALEALVTTVPSVDPQGKTISKEAGAIAVRLAALTVVAVAAG